MVKHRIFLLTLISLIFSVILSSCNFKREAVGQEDLIYVFADSTEYFQLEPVLLQVFSKVIYTPQEENLFDLLRTPISLIEKHQGKKNLLIIAPLNSGTYTSQYISKILEDSVVNMVKEENLFTILKKDLWAKNQLVMILTSPTIEQLKENILSDHENLLFQFQNISDQRLFKSLYNPTYEKKKIEAEFLKDYGWIIYVQADFYLAKSVPEENFVWIRRAPGSDMERWIFVHWLENASPTFLDPDSIAQARNKVTKLFYRTPDDSAYVEIADQYFESKEVNFEGRYAIMIQGLWRMSDKSMGGPFVNYTFYDEETKRIYILDGSIYAPKYYKKKLIQQVDVTLHSFRTKEQLTEDRIDDLLSELE
jgi:hypothetical protein